jgi:2,3,4,5-tetrahydropyridine-2-carboxylate N-succinyltransferase
MKTGESRVRTADYIAAIDPAALQAELARFAGPIAPESRREARNAVARLVRALESGQVRAAVRDATGGWRAEPWVKEGILLAFRLGRPMETGAAGAFSFVDKDTLPIREFREDDGVRIVPGGTTIRSGAYVAPGVICMPPSFINVGAWVDEGTMIDSHVLVGSCAQVGRRVHLSAGAQLGGVLEPARAMPVIIEDDVLVGGNCGVFEGVVVREHAVLAPGTTLSAGTMVFDVVHDRILRAEPDRPLEIPAGAVVVPGSRPIKDGPGRAHGLSLYAPVIVKYRDDRTEAAVRLEENLR